MLKEGCEPGTEQRCKLLRILSNKRISYSTQIKLTEYMRGKPISIKEQIAEKLLSIIETSESEEEMLKRARTELIFKE